MEASARAAAIVLAAGEGQRIGAEEPKAFLAVGGRPIFVVAAAAATASPAVGSLLVAVPPGFEERARAALEGITTPWSTVAGGPTRQASVAAALRSLDESVEIVAVHDAARPFASPELFSEVIAAVAEGVDGAIPIIPVTDTVKRVRGGLVVGTEPREELGLAQTPQAFRVKVLREAHARANAEGVAFTDDAALLELSGVRVRAVAGDPANFKITTLSDLARADRLLSGADV